MANKAKYNIRVRVEPKYLEDQSDPLDDRYVFAYTVTIRNEGRIAARLMSRHWIIVDSNGLERQVRGEGVIGEQPYLAPGEDFRYTSGAMIDTPVGTMQGSYQMVAEDGFTFDAPIPPFTLAIPRTLH